MEGGVRIETKRLILREYAQTDLTHIHALLSNVGTMYYLPDLLTHTLEETRADMALSMAEIGDVDRTQYFLWIVEKEGGYPVGSVGYTVTEFTPVGKLVHLGFFSYRRCWNNGYMTEAVRALLRFAFEENDVCRVSTGCLAENVGSEQVMRKCGMVKEAERRDWTWFDGALKTRLEYRLLRDEWRSLEAEKPGGGVQWENQSSWQCEK